MADNLWVRLGAVGLFAIALPQQSGSAQQVAVMAHEAHITVSLDRVLMPTALETIAKAANLRMVYEKSALPSEARVTLNLRDVPVSQAFAAALTGTGLGVVISSRGQVILGRVEDGPRSIQGTVVGRVTDAKTGLPLRGAKISVDGTDRAEAAGDGSYRIVVSPGTHTVIFKMLGYSKVTRTVTVQDNTAVQTDVVLESSATPLDQVVVTGTVIPTELKAVPNAITVITAKDIERRGITKIDQLFRGDIPGLFASNFGSNLNALLDEVTMFSRGATALSGASVPGSQTGTTNPIKTYVDGIELADPKYLSQIDPKSIERIEILTGPQASTIYGSNAINGVMQIFTKRGTTAVPQLTLNLLSGFVQNNFSSALTPQHDYSAQVSGLEGRFSYNAGGSWNYVGPWSPGKRTSRTDGFGGARLDLPTPVGRVSADMTFRRGVTQSLQRGALDQTTTAYSEDGWYTNRSSSGLDKPTTRTLTGQTLGLTLSYVPTSWWSHELGVGQDVSDTERRVTARGYQRISDTTLDLRQDHTDRRSLRYATTAHVPVTSLAQLTVTAGADAWANLTSSMEVSPQTLTGSLAGSTSVSRQPGHNTGGFLQTQLGLKDQFFFTYGLRAEWNPGYGADAQPNYAPRYGMAYTHDVGLVTVKLRGSYGRSTRPPQAGLKVAQTIADVLGSSTFTAYILPYYGSLFDYISANPELAPEHQQGGEGGLELYLGTRGSLVVTRYNQTIDGLIDSPAVDSVRTVVPCTGTCFFYTSLDTQGYGYQQQYRYLNIGSIRNQGWELQGSVNTGPFTTRGTYSWTKSRTIGVDPKYRAYFANSAQYQPGATFRFLPEHTWALGVMYARNSSNVGLNVTGTGRATNAFDAFYYRNLISDIRLLQNQLNVSNSGSYINFNAGYAMVDLTASHRFGSHVEGVLQVQNLADHYTNDYWAAFASLGRQVKLGLRLRTP